MLKLCLILTLALIQTNAFAPMRNPCNDNDDCNDDNGDIHDNDDNDSIMLCFPLQLSWSSVWWSHYDHDKNGFDL